ncbi:GTP-binding protein GEM isoform X3 [Leopardus geoffroyi]|uniref:GTP-binding protein GEM isoform X3 n=2 Tax=Felinae TaxID=338152 RepID=UPI000F427330|nr:GTP-binding protein GEM isoform X3 [Felis catus]XP_045310167.1 GTP-binding protein GEM isoform X3 [Leopardus geoffroyi]
MEEARGQWVMLTDPAMTLNNVTMRQGTVAMQPQQQRWSIPADGRHLMVQKEPHQYGQRSRHSAAPEDHCRRSWSSDSTDSVISSESGNTYYRVVLIGEQGVGKSTLANIFAGVHDSMDSDCEVLGEDTYERTLIVDGESATIILLDMWENKGENEWLQDHCMQVGDAYLIVYSITDRASFEKASELRIQLRRARQTEDIPIILVGNKSDLVRCREVSVSVEHLTLRLLQKACLYSLLSLYCTCVKSSKSFSRRESVCCGVRLQVH